MRPARQRMIAPIEVIVGTPAIEQIQPALVRLAERCEQPGAADYVQFFLTQPYTGGKIPTLLLFTTMEQGTSEGLQLLGAVLVHQYQRWGMPFGIFVSEDSGGERNVIAPPSRRSEIAAAAVAYLLKKKKAKLVVLSTGAHSTLNDAMDAHCSFATWTLVQRELRRYLPLRATYEETIGAMGQHTRRNFRLYRRRAELELGCGFHANAYINEADFLMLNNACDYPVPLRVAKWRYRSVHAAPGGVFAGVQANDGRWLSILGGRRSHGTLAIDWQMNRTDSSRFSPGTVMRAYVMEHEIDCGTRRILFEGGTPHSMNSAFVIEHVTDIIGASKAWPSVLLWRYALQCLPPGNCLKQTLSKSDLMRDRPVFARENDVTRPTVVPVRFSKKR